MRRKVVCRIFIPIALSLLVSLGVAAQERVPALVIHGEVTKIELKRTDPRYVDCRMDVSLKFINLSSKPIIILRSDSDNSPRSFVLGGVSLAKSQADSEAGRYIYDSQTWPAVDRSPSWKALTQELDQPSPPKSLTRILQAKQSWTWSTFIQIRFFYKTSNQDWGWDQIAQINEPLWLRLSCGMWPDNLERADSGIAERLQKRWQLAGQLWLNNASTHGILVSEPIMIRLNESKVMDN